MKKIILATALGLAITGCAAQTSDTQTITVEPSMGEYGKLGKIAEVGKFGYNNKTNADWTAAYASCASAAGVNGDVQMKLQDYGTATTIDLLEGSNVSKEQKARAFACMSNFASQN